jgi:hypothetical protein
MKRKRRKQQSKSDWEYSLKKLNNSKIENLVRFYDVPTTEFVEVSDLDNIPDIKDKIVKVCPRINSSDKAKFDRPGILQEMYKLGAKSVVLAPIIASDKKKVQSKPSKNVEPREVVKLWFDEQPISNKEKQQCVELLYLFMDKENM